MVPEMLVNSMNSAQSLGIALFSGKSASNSNLRVEETAELSPAQDKEE